MGPDFALVSLLLISKSRGKDEANEGCWRSQPVKSQSLNDTKKISNRVSEQ